MSLNMASDVLTSTPPSRAVLLGVYRSEPHSTLRIASCEIGMLSEKKSEILKLKVTTGDKLKVRKISQPILILE